MESEEDVEEEDLEGEEGKTWDELEAKARNAYKEKGDESHSEEERWQQKVKAIGKSWALDIRDSRGMLAKRHKVR